jgi:hypothetical protein
VLLDKDAAFEIDYQGTIAKVSEHYIGEERIFRVGFPDGRKTLILTVALDRDKRKFWTSLPQGRQQEASEIGPLIAMYFKNNKQ